jgi:hypothetical protein
MVNESGQVGETEGEETREERLLRALHQAYLSIESLSEEIERVLMRTKDTLDSFESLDPPGGC